MKVRCPGRVTAVLQPQLEHVRKVLVGKVAAENSLEFEVSEHLLVLSKRQLVYGTKVQDKNIS